MPPSYDAGGSRSSLYYARLSRLRYPATLSVLGRDARGIRPIVHVLRALDGDVPRGGDLPRRLRVQHVWRRPAGSLGPPSPKWRGPPDRLSVAEPRWRYNQTSAIAPKP